MIHIWIYKGAIPDAHLSVISAEKKSLSDQILGVVIKSNSIIFNIIIHYIINIGSCVFLN